MVEKEIIKENRLKLANLRKERAKDIKGSKKMFQVLDCYTLKSLYESDKKVDITKWLGRKSQVTKTSFDKQRLVHGKNNKLYFLDYYYINNIKKTILNNR